MDTMNWAAGWVGIGAGMISGAILGLGFHRDDFMGGYSSFRRRLARLGHIALIALGALNVLYAYGPASSHSSMASTLFIVGLIAMPAVCFLTAWRTGFRQLFFVPVSALMAAVAFTAYGGLS